MIEVTKQMVQEIYSRIDFHYHGDDGIAEGLAVVLALVERDYRVGPREPLVHLATAGDGHVHCCGRTPFELPRTDLITMDPHGATCKGPS